MTETPRTQLADTFLARAGLKGAVRAPLAGDASNRRYERVRAAGETLVLMDAPAERGEDVRPFIAIARHLSSLGLSAPRILAEDAAQGFLLLEDLGDDLYASLLRKDAGEERLLYAAAVDALVELHRHPAPDGVGRYAPPLLGDLAALAVDWYLPGTGAEPVDRAPLAEAVNEAALRHAGGPEVLVLRDYHAENLLWLPEREGAARVGLLDFQDARRGHPAYDLVSLLEDARRDTSETLRQEMIARYITETGAEDAGFRAAYATLGAQRNLRILGVFARLCLRDGKPRYLAFIPRVWDHLMRDISHPALADLSRLVRETLPEPTPKRLERIKERCGTRACP
ncbi:aminoglycoside phosphotransferase [Haematobacter missouriensis]|uniref:Aminoglycoside phosphotransferase n=1 Tax=Haematobacter missouriensis TaxID=366616 RepID=A0A212ARQ5_9RHOB|nr:phosphotransferase [Haematobacter missouriensis]KFI33826.1 aminoglycoside phosphotransferase [Haematobacter missouriensis]OWJ72252.1 aminoglycoside phosphotransferase [Haematobacter missouriensis]OWJ84159.1 aminoglycoside phosphotransferase [Haematobacter missouriensis]